MPATNKADLQAIPIQELWNASNPELWDQSLDRYWDFVQPEDKAFEHEMNELNPVDMKKLDAEQWYEFLKYKYFKWKYRAHWYKTTTDKLDKHIEKYGLCSLLVIRDRVFKNSNGEVIEALRTVCDIGGLGVAGGSGLLSLLFPHMFGTVDQFVVKALREVDSLPEHEKLMQMDPENLNFNNGVILTNIMREKAKALNDIFCATSWTPRKVDMILWTSQH